MCRFIAYKGRPIVISKLLHETTNSLIRQSIHAREREEPLNGDGFGLAWYSKSISKEPALFRSIRPAWNDKNLISISEKTISDCVFAHVRAATSGEVAEYNCHPFLYKNLLLMHNGDVADFAKIKRELRRSLPDDLYHWIRGQADTEHFFALFLSVLGSENVENCTLEQAREALEKTLVKLWQLQGVEPEAPSTLNLVISNGDWLMATKIVSKADAKPNTLYYAMGGSYDCRDGVGVFTKDTGVDSSILVVSEKLDDQINDWKVLETNHVLMVDEDNKVKIIPVENALFKVC